MPTLESRAKINLFLEVTGKRDDGFHNLDSVFLEVDLADRLTVEPAPAGVFSLVCDDPRLPPTDDNLVLRAARLLAAECGVNAGCRFTLEKRVPLGGGLGGGSSNAAAALRLVNDLWGAGLPTARLAVLGERLGSDVPFFLHGGLCHVRGRGEIVERIGKFPLDLPLALVVSTIQSHTWAAFAGLRLPGPAKRRPIEPFLRALADGDAGHLAAEAFNRFEATVFTAIPCLGALHRRLELVLGFPVRLSGSGSSFWFIGDAVAAAERARGDLSLADSMERHGLRILPARPAV